MIWEATPTIRPTYLRVGMVPNSNRRCLWPLSNCSNSQVSMINWALCRTEKRSSPLSLHTSACSSQRNRFISAQFAMILAGNYPLLSVTISFPFYSSSAQTLHLFQRLWVPLKELGEKIKFKKKFKKSLRKLQRKLKRKEKSNIKEPLNSWKTYFPTL